MRCPVSPKKTLLVPTAKSVGGILLGHSVSLVPTGVISEGEATGERGGPESTAAALTSHVHTNAHGEAA